MILHILSLHLLLSRTWPGKPLSNGIFYNQELYWSFKPIGDGSITSSVHHNSSQRKSSGGLYQDNFGTFYLGLISTLHLQNEDVTKVGISRMVASATQNILKESQKTRVGSREIHQTRIDLVDTLIFIDIASLKLQMRIFQVLEAAKILRRQIRIQELVEDGAWKPGVIA